jgi:L-rhamnose isomerase
MLAQNDIKLKELANDLGYTISAMNVNWSKKEISGKAEKSFLLYIKARNLEKENSELQKLISEKKKNIELSNNLSSKALQIAQQKCSKNNINLEEYLSSLVMVNI